MKIIINLLAVSIIGFLFACGGAGSSDSTVTPATAGITTEPIDFAQAIVTDYSADGFKHVKNIAPNGGLITSEGPTYNGKKEGTWIVYYTGRDSNKIKKITNYHQDQISGLSLEFSNSGTITKRVDYDNGQIHGIYAEYKYNRAQKYIEYTNGVMNGAYNTYYSNGKKQQETAYTNGKKNGKSIFYNEEEQVIMEFDYKNGDKISGGKVDPPRPTGEK